MDSVELCNTIKNHKATDCAKPYCTNKYLYHNVQFLDDLGVCDLWSFIYGWNLSSEMKQI
jgi:hypothetical protein